MTTPRAPFRTIPSRHGFTLIELVVVLAILGIMAGVAGLTMHTAAPAPVAPTFARIATLRDSAISRGRPVTATIWYDTQATAVTAYPDGRVVSEIGAIDRVTGRPHPTQ